MSSLASTKQNGLSKPHQSLYVQISDQKQVPSYICNGSKAIITEYIERKKANLLSNFCQTNEYKYGTMANESQTQLRFLQGKSSLQYIPQAESKAITATTIDAETSLDIKPGKIYNMIVVSDILVNRHKW